MRPVILTQTGVGISPVCPMDREQAPFNAGIGCVVNGTATYNIEHTFDDVQNAAVTPTWFQNTGITAQTTNANGNYAFPIRAVRVNVTAGTGTVTATILQARR